MAKVARPHRERKKSPIETHRRAWDETFSRISLRPERLRAPRLAVEPGVRFVLFFLSDSYREQGFAATTFHFIPPRFRGVLVSQGNSTNNWVMSSEYLTAHRQFEMDSRQENAEASAQARKKTLEEEATRELDEKMGNTLADFQIWPACTAEDGNAPHIYLYTLTMKVVFMP